MIDTASHHVNQGANDLYQTGGATPPIWAGMSRRQLSAAASSERRIWPPATFVAQLLRGGGGD